MKTDPQPAILRVASWLAPGDRRAEWLDEWRSELCHVPQCRAMAFCLSAFGDALWLRRNNLSPAAHRRLSTARRPGPSTSVEIHSPPAACSMPVAASPWRRV
jgi:hypothetical protein